MEDVLGSALMLTGDQDLGSQRLRLEQAGAIRIFPDVRDRTMSRDNRKALPGHARPSGTPTMSRLDRFGQPWNASLSTVEGVKAHGDAPLSFVGSRGSA